MKLFARFLATTVVTTYQVVYLNILTTNEVVTVPSPTATTDTSTTTTTITITTTTTLPDTFYSHKPSATATATTTTTPRPTPSHTFLEIMLAQHNLLRSLHGFQLLSWNDTLFQFAQNYANKYDCSGTLKHSGGPYGENLAIGYTPKNSVDAWYNESATYDYSKQNTVYNHFTQLIWNSTSQVGCATKYCNEVWGSYIICSYFPAGNIIGEETTNVLPPL